MKNMGCRKCEAELTPMTGQDGNGRTKKHDQRARTIGQPEIAKRDPGRGLCCVRHAPNAPPEQMKNEEPNA